MSIASRIPAVTVTLAVATAIVTGIVAYTQTAKLLHRTAEQMLVSLLETREQALETLMGDVSNDLDLHRSNPWMMNALVNFQTAWPEFEEGPGEALRDLYVSSNRHPVDERHLLIDAEDGSAYSAIHRIFHPSARRYLASRGLDDLFLFDPDGNLLYSVTKGSDFATNIDHGLWADTGLGRAFRAARDNPTTDYMAFEDFALYGPSHSGPAGFIAAPMLDADGNFVGVLAYQMPIDRLNRVMQVHAGMGDTGETYLVGEDMLMRSDSRFSEISTILRTSVDTLSVHRALSGESGVTKTVDYRGIPVLSAYSGFSFHGVRWAVLAEVDEAEILEPLRELRLSLLWVVLFTAIVISTIGAIVAFNITKPLIEMKDAVLRLANDDLSVIIPGGEDTDGRRGCR